VAQLSVHGRGPDLAIVGSARSGTTFLAAQLAEHPSIDAGAVKEPNFFSREYGRGHKWYESLYEPRREGVYRLDASTSTTFPQFPEALSRLAAAAPDAFVVYVVRPPVSRALSHYLYLLHYFHNESAETFGAALENNAVYLGASDCRRWLDAISRVFPIEQTVVVPFCILTEDQRAVTRVVYDGLAIPDWEPSAAAASHRNEVVSFRRSAYRSAYHRLRRGRLYPWARRRLGMQRMRRLRALVTTDTPLATLTEALASCDDYQLQALESLHCEGRAAVSASLREQDARTGLSWSPMWEASITPDPRLQRGSGPPGV
jgi:hypothetical protein